jgi:predicted double-glycine peptidase
MHPVNIDVINKYLAATEKINSANEHFLYASDAQHAAVTLIDYTMDQFSIKKAELAQAKLEAKPAIRAYNRYIKERDGK